MACLILYKRRIIMFDSENDEMVTMDGFDDCILGICMRCGQEDVVAYDYAKVIETLMSRDGMDHDDAIEYFHFNQLGAWVGEHTPCFILLDKDSVYLYT